jgi:hypothetical protein
MLAAMEEAAVRRRLRVFVGFFVAALVASGLTAFPLQWELGLLSRWLGADLGAPEGGLRWWIAQVNEGLTQTYRAYPFLGYGTDWLAFGHLVIAMFFIGPWRDPVANAWVFKVALLACAGIIPLAMIRGAIRGIPIYWRLIDCSFGVFGAIPLWYALRLVEKLKRTTPSPTAARPGS